MLNRRGWMFLPIRLRVVGWWELLSGHKRMWNLRWWWWRRRRRRWECGQSHVLLAHMHQLNRFALTKYLLFHIHFATSKYQEASSVPVPKTFIFMTTNGPAFVTIVLIWTTISLTKRNVHMTVLMSMKVGFWVDDSTFLERRFYHETHSLKAIHADVHPVLHCKTITEHASKMLFMRPTK